MTRKESVLMAMSGGVDSSVAALLLKQQGFETTGVTFRLYRNEALSQESRNRTCCSLDDVECARAVAFNLGLPHYVLDFSGLFERTVIERFCNGYLLGMTPNPCIDCNRFIKFEAFEQRRQELGIDYIATGHYVRHVYDERSGRHLLKRGLDINKDQSYVLYHLSQETLAHMLFPLGELTKPQVRELAKVAGFANSEKAESQDICFVPDGDYARFIEHHESKNALPGPILDESGRKMGEHEGLLRYTIGQRRGLGIAAAHPLYVVDKDVGRNALIVGPASSLEVTHVIADDINLISMDVIEQPLRAEAKVNYRQPARPAVASIDDDGQLVVVFDDPIRACAPGQSVVLYQGDTVVGGATIRDSR